MRDDVQPIQDQPMPVVEGYTPPEVEAPTYQPEISSYQAPESRFEPSPPATPSYEPPSYSAPSHDSGGSSYDSGGGYSSGGDSGGGSSGGGGD